MTHRSALAGVAALACAVVASGATGASVQPALPASNAAATPTRAQMVGQRMIISMNGTHADAALLARIRAGQVGGIILFRSNIVDATQVTALTQALQSAAAAGGQPPLLIATDQEGGLVRRL